MVFRLLKLLNEGVKMSDTARIKDLCDRIMDCFDVSYHLMLVYDSMPHKYGDSVLYQVESHTIERIGMNPGITATELASMMGKTTSACSQIIRKLKNKGLVSQKRNEENSREYNLFLTEHGWTIYRAHAAVDEECGQRKLKRLSGFSETELETYLKIHQIINEEFGVDVRQAENIFESLKFGDEHASSQ